MDVIEVNNKCNTTTETYCCLR